MNYNVFKFRSKRFRRHVRDKADCEILAMGLKTQRGETKVHCFVDWNF